MNEDYTVKEKSLIFLKKMYELSKGNINKQIASGNIAKELNFTDEEYSEIKSIVSYLKEKNFVNIVDYGIGGIPGWLKITYHGIDIINK